MPAQQPTRPDHPCRAWIDASIAQCYYPGVVTLQHGGQCPYSVLQIRRSTRRILRERERGESVPLPRHENQSSTMSEKIGRGIIIAILRWNIFCHKSHGKFTMKNKFVTNFAMKLKFIENFATNLTFIAKILPRIFSFIVKFATNKEFIANFISDNLVLF